MNAPDENSNDVKTEETTSEAKSTEEVNQIIETPAELQKRLGNEAFSAKKYQQAIIHYSAAIKLDPEVAIYYSNRSACYAFLKQWKLSLEDAEMCLTKDTKSVKGHYRLAQAQIELMQLDEAESTIIAALKLDPENEPILKQRRMIASARASHAKAYAQANKPVKELDETQKKEYMELHDKSTALHRQLRNVQAKISALQRETRTCQVTSNYLLSVEPEVPVFKAVGKAFVKIDRTSIDKELDTEAEENTKAQRDLESQKEYLDRQITSIQQNMRDIALGM